MEKVLQFAKEELGRYWKKVTGESACAVRVGLLPAGERSPREDEYAIDIDAGQGTIFASNPRSALLGVYAFFRKLGCRFLYPTEQGEELVQKSASQCSVHCRERASYCHRGITIEGCVSNKNVLDIIDWMPKIGFNSYFSQFPSANIFFRKWYDHWWNPFLEKRTFTREELERYTENAVRELQKRGMVYHAVGHGWTCEPLGIPADGWDEIPDEALAPNMRDKIALVNGERKFFHGMPLTTNLCYSNADARKMMVDCILQYLEKHQPDVLHIWLADDCNNFCTCEKCRRTTYSDQYVELLNEIDEALSERGNTTRIVFLLYNELMYPPCRARLKNPDRFILMFAPSGRSYNECLASDVPEEELPPLEEGKFRPPVTLGANLSFLRGWQKCFSGDSFIFDYPLMHAVCKEISGFILAETIEKDVNALDELGLHGYLSCQLQRVFFPTGFPLYVLGRKLWNKSLTYNELEQEYFSAAYGTTAGTVIAVLKEISSFLPDDYMNHRLPERDKKIVLRAESEIIRTAELEKSVANLVAQAEGKSAERLKLLLFALQYLGKLLHLIAVKAQGEPQHKVDCIRDEIQHFVFKKEPEIQPYMDVGQYYCNVLILAKDHWETLA